MAELTRAGGSCATCGEPIDRRATHCRRHAKAPEGDPETLAELEMLAGQYDDLRAQTERAKDRFYAAMKAAKASGHSYGQIREATGRQVSTIQGIVER